MLYIKH